MESSLWYSHVTEDSSKSFPQVLHGILFWLAWNSAAASSSSGCCWSVSRRGRTSSSAWCIRFWPRSCHSFIRGCLRGSPDQTFQLAESLVCLLCHSSDCRWGCCSDTAWLLRHRFPSGSRCSTWSRWWTGSNRSIWSSPFLNSSRSSDNRTRWNSWRWGSNIRNATSGCLFPVFTREQSLDSVIRSICYMTEHFGQQERKIGHDKERGSRNSMEFQ